MTVVSTETDDWAELVFIIKGTAPFVWGGWNDAFFERGVGDPPEIWKQQHRQRHNDKGEKRMPAARGKAGAAIDLDPIDEVELEVEVKGTSPLIVHNWSPKAKRMMLAKQMGETIAKEHKDPEADFESSRYRLADTTDGFPADGFKKATVGGARFFRGSVTMTSLRQMLFIVPDDPVANLVRISGFPEMREDTVRLESGVADIRYRAQYTDWGALLRVRFIPSVITAKSVVALINAGGRVGVGEWRPERGGNYGTYQVLGTSEV